MTRIGDYELTGNCTCKWQGEPHHDECPLSVVGAYAILRGSLAVLRKVSADVVTQTLGRVNGNGSKIGNNSRKICGVCGWVWWRSPGHYQDCRVPALVAELLRGSGW
jgi:hypothetical protein